MEFETDGFGEELLEEEEICFGGPAEMDDGVDCREGGGLLDAVLLGDCDDGGSGF